MSVPVNYLAIVIAAIANMIVGSVWFSKALFANQWMALIGKTHAQLKRAQQAMVLAAVVSLIEAYVLARFIIFSGESTLLGGAKIGLWVWVGFVATVMSGMVIFENRPMKLYYITAGYQLVSFLVMGAIIASMH